MLNWLKKLVFGFFNPKSRPFRNKTGKVIDDLRQRKHSKEIQKKLDSGELKRPGYHGTDVKYKKGEEPKCFQILTKGKVVTLKTPDN